MAARGLDAEAVRAGVRPAPDSARLLSLFYQFVRFRGPQTTGR